MYVSYNFVMHCMYVAVNIVMRTQGGKLYLMIANYREKEEVNKKKIIISID